MTPTEKTHSPPLPPEAVLPPSERRSETTLTVDAQPGSQRPGQLEIDAGGSALDNERPARQHITARSSTLDFQQRADWLESEAKRRPDSAARARLLLAASEIQALLGAPVEARRLALAAQRAAPSLPWASEQVRSLSQTQADWALAAKDLSAESPSPKTAAVRAHERYLAGEIARLRHKNEAATDNELDAAELFDPDQARIALARIAQKLARSRKPPEVQLAASGPLESLEDALIQLRKLRGDSSPDQQSSPLQALSLVDARAAASRGDLPGLAAALAPLAARPGLARPLRWLDSFWLSPPSDPEGPSLAAIRQLVRDSPGRLQRRALAARALRSRRLDLMREALHGSAEHPAPGDSAAPDRSPAFSEQERAALIALVTPPAGAPWAATTEAEAVPPQRVELALGFAAARVERTAELETHALAASSGWALALRLERAVESADATSLASLLAELPLQPAQIAEAHFVAGVLSERAHDAGAANQHYQAAQLSNAAREAAVRALSSVPGEGAALFRSLSAHARDAQQRSLLLTEALLRSSLDAAEFDALAEEAVRADPELPFAYELGELAARMRGDRARVGRWLARQRESACGALELEFRSVREALFCAQTEPERAAHLLDTGAALDSLDITRQALREKLGGVSALERARFRERLAAASTPYGRQGWLSEAVDLYLAAAEPQSALSCAQKLGGPPGRHWFEDLATSSEDLRQLMENYGRLAREARDVDTACDLYERASRLATACGEMDRARSFQRALVASRPASLHAWRWLERDAMGAGRENDLVEVARALVKLLDAPHAEPYLFACTRFSIDRGSLEETRPFVARALGMSPPPLWALRVAAALAKSEGDDRQLLRILEQLRERAGHELDVATLSLRLAEAAARLGQPDRANLELARAAAASPDNVVVLSLRAELASSRDDPAAALLLEELASMSRSPARRADALYRAALAWFNMPGERARGETALAAAGALAAPSPALVERLRHIAPLPTPPAPAPDATDQWTPERANLELARAIALIENGNTDQARRALSALLERDPHKLGAYTSLAELELAAGNWTAAEAAFRRVVEAARGGEERVAALRGLLRLYERELAEPERARSVCLLLLADDPDDVDTRQRLVSHLNEHGELAAAIEQQRELLGRAPNDERRRKALLDLVELVGRRSNGNTEAASLLEQARRTWPERAEILEAQVSHYRRAGDNDSARIILERAVNAGRNAIRAGRLEIELLDTLELGTRLSGDPDTARAARAARAALRGEELHLPGAGAGAGQPRFDDLLAPAPLSSGFRRLLYGAGSAIERAFAVDPISFGAVRASDQLVASAQAVAATFGLTDVLVASSERLGCDCICVSAGPVYVLFGHALLEHPNASLREFLLLRALKIAQANACAMSRLPPAELWSAVAGFLACFAPAWPAEGVDAQRLIAARNRIRPHVTAMLTPELQALVPAVTSNVVPQAAQLGDALWRWASRVALLGVGDLGVALEALWVVGGLGPNPPRELDARVRWIASNSGARDLVGYGVSEAYTEARRRAGLDSP